MVKYDFGNKLVQLFVKSMNITIYEDRVESECIFNPSGDETITYTLPTDCEVELTSNAVNYFVSVVQNDVEVRIFYDENAMFLAGYAYAKLDRCKNIVCVRALTNTWRRSSNLD